MRLDLNADIGESVGDDEAILGVVTSANIACGGHAGDESSMRRTVERAVAADVAIGAHPSYVDRENFGRAPVRVTAPTLQRQLGEQLQALTMVAAQAGVSVRYVKPHGALYHAIRQDGSHAQALVAAVSTRLPGAALLVAPGGIVTNLAAEAGVRVVAEGFADRAYDDDGSLLPRSMPGAVITDPDQAAAQAVGIAQTATVRTPQGRPAACPVDSICVHGDTPGAVALAWRVRRALEAAGVTLGARW